MQISMKTCYKLILCFWWAILQYLYNILKKKLDMSNFTMSLQYLKEEVRDKVDFFHSDKHQSFLQVHFNNLGTKVSYKVILLLLMSMI